MAFWGFPRYVPKAEKQARAAKKLEKLKKKQDVKPVILQGGSLAATWWGKAWNRNLERYADYSNRIGRGRSYVRHGAVLDLQISEGRIAALVQGSRSKPYEIAITIKKLNRAAWEKITAACAGRLESLAELLEGKFPQSLADVFMEQGGGLFPGPKEITFACSCPDWASMCKHVAAALYGVGARLDEEPALFFVLRGADTAELVSRTVSSTAEGLLEKASRTSSRVIADSDLSELFGIEFAEQSGPPTVQKHEKAASKRVKTGGKPSRRAAAAKKAASGKKAAARKKAAPSKAAKRKGVRSGTRSSN